MDDIVVNSRAVAWVYSKVLKGKIVNGEFEFERRARVLSIIVATTYSGSKV